MEWESPPAEILQEWIETSKKKPNQDQHSWSSRPLITSQRSNLQKSYSSTYFYSALEDLPISRPPVDCNLTQKTPRKAPTSAPKTATPEKQTNTKTTPPHNPGQPRNSCPGIQNPRPTTLPKAALPSQDQSILKFFASKHAKKGSPQKKKARKLPSSPVRDDISNATSEAEWQSPPTAPISSPPRPVFGSHRHLLFPSEDFDASDSATDDFSLEDTLSPHATPQSPNLPLTQPFYPPNLQRHTAHPLESFVSSSDSTNDYKSHIDAHQSHDPSDNIEQRSEDHSHHEISSHHPFHDEHGTEYNTATLYQQPCQLPDDISNSGSDQETNLSDTPTILVSDDDADQSDPEYPLGPPLSSHSTSIPFDSMQYNNQSADSEDKKG